MERPYDIVRPLEGPSCEGPVSDAERLEFARAVLRALSSTTTTTKEG